MELCEGAIVDVTISSVEDFGLLVDYKGKSGVVLVTNLYWDCDGAQKRMFVDFKPGQVIRVLILVITPNQFSGSIKHLSPDEDPWRDPRVYREGSKHSGTVKLIFEFGGALVKLKGGVDVFVEKLTPTVALGDHVEVVVRNIDVERQKIEGELA